MRPSRALHRKSVKKSRHGCQECKRRHVKCDETRPSCANCVVRHSQCSFLSTIGSLPARSSSSASASASVSTASESPHPDEAAAAPIQHSTCDTLVAPTPWSQYEPAITINSLVSTNQTFKLHHLELLHNFKAGVLGESVLDLAAADGYMAMIVREAVQAPYLMDQVLAVSAANMSVKRPHQRRFYQEEATHLQTRGLTLFNASRALEAADHAMAGFVFSTLLSHHVLFDAFSTRTDFPMLLDRLVAAFRVCGGVRIVCGKSWPFIVTQYHQQVGINPEEFIARSGSQTILTTKLAHLETLLADANLSPSILNPCNTALNHLRDLSYSEDRRRLSAFQTTRLLQWAVVIPPDFINLVEERRPEALIIIAYYALLIHDTRGYWVSGDAGAFIIRSITSFLGKYWAGWLAWPNEVLDSVDPNNGATLLSTLDISTQCSTDEVP
ncbi:hypothetical protein F5Y12DRAFT_142833 [Xylaria sp. FL1777]|nr:hypothetical protein F5Y12DRAFT_142833 [Xylaria sp. FL1777]